MYGESNICEGRDVGVDLLRDRMGSLGLAETPLRGDRVSFVWSLPVPGLQSQRDGKEKRNKKMEVLIPLGLR